MPMFSLNRSSLRPVAQRKFPNEKVLQQLIEANLEAVFRCRYVASEFSTGVAHGGRIDTLALSEENNPVIIEYKNVESSDLINQSLFYLSWIHDHRGDFEMAVQRTLGPKVAVDWDDIRVICIAPNYRRYDLHAAKVMGANIELWTYRLFENDVMFLEEVLQKIEPEPSTGSGPPPKNPVMAEAGRKAAASRRTGKYTFEEKLVGKPDSTRQIALAVNDFVTSLDAGIEVVPKKLYVAYKTSQNIVCMEVQKQKVLLFLKVDPKIDKGPAGISRDVTSIGHFGTGDLEVTIRTPKDLDLAKSVIQRAYEKVGG